MKNWKTSVTGHNFVMSYSGGKDSTLALYKAMQTGEATLLISRLRKEDSLAGAHGVSREILQAQADSMNLPLFTFSTDWTGYRAGLISSLEKAKKMGAEVFVTGDIDLPEHKCWHEHLVEEVGLQLSIPLWQYERKKAVQEFLELGFISKIVSIDCTKGMKESDLGKILTPTYIKELEERGIDCCGEAGEFHTIVLDGPIFHTPLKVREGNIFHMDNHLCLELELLS